MKQCIQCKSEVKDDQPICEDCYHEKLPKCPKCGQTYIWIRGGDKEKHEFWDGYYRCQNKCLDPKSYCGAAMYKIKERDVFVSLKRTYKEQMELFK